MHYEKRTTDTETPISQKHTSHPPPLLGPDHTGRPCLHPLSLLGLLLLGSRLSLGRRNGLLLALGRLLDGLSQWPTERVSETPRSVEEARGGGTNLFLLRRLVIEVLVLLEYFLRESVRLLVLRCMAIGESARQVAACAVAPSSASREQSRVGQTCELTCTNLPSPRRVCESPTTRESEESASARAREAARALPLVQGTHRNSPRDLRLDASFVPNEVPLLLSEPEHLELRHTLAAFERGQRARRAMREG